MRKKTWERKEIVTLPPLYIRAPGSTHTISLVVIHKGVEVVVIQVGPPISRSNIWLVKWVDRAVIDHVAWVVASSTDPKIAFLIGVSPSTTEITLGLQTMMGSVTGSCFLTGGAAIHGAEEPMVTEIRTNVALSGRRAGTGVLHKDSGGGQSDPLSFSDLDADGVIVGWFIGHWGGSR